jgi:hypothetical protein
MTAPFAFETIPLTGETRSPSGASECAACRATAGASGRAFPIQSEAFEFEADLPATEAEFAGESFEFEAEEEFEASDAQKSWYYFDAWWLKPGSAPTRLKWHRWALTSKDASRLFDTFCLTQQNDTRDRTGGRLVVRCYQWLPVSSRWIPCKNVSGFKRGMCASEESELGETEEHFFGGFPVLAKKPILRYVKDFSGPAAECTAAMRRAGKSRAEALAIIDAQIGAAIAMLRKAAAKLKRDSRSAATSALFLKIFRVRPNFVPTWLKPTATVKDRGDVVAVRCQRVADLLASGTLGFFCTINSTNCPDCADDPSDYACSSWGRESAAPERSNVICLGNAFWDDMKAGDTASLLATLMHEPFHIYYGRYVTEHVPGRGKFGGINCIVRFAFEANGRAAPARVNQRCADTAVRKEIAAFM